MISVAPSSVPSPGASPKNMTHHVMAPVQRAPRHRGVGADPSIARVLLEAGAARLALSLELVEQGDIELMNLGDDEW